MAAVERLKRRSDFLRTAEARRKFVAPGLILQARQNRRPAESTADAPAAQEGLRVGFTASRKVGNAVARNRARRRLRAAVAELMPQRAASGHDYVLVARAGTLTRAYADLLGDLEAGLRRLGLWQTPGA